MFELLFDNTSMPVMQQVLSFAERRQEVLNHNVANFNTPGFRSSDLPVGEFTSALDKAIDRRDRSTPRRFVMRSTENISFGPQMQIDARPVGGLMNYYDGADRSIERLQNEIAKNRMWHEMAARLFTHQSELLETAIRERVV